MRSLCESPVALKITAFYERGLHLAEFLHKTPNFDLFFYQQNLQVLDYQKDAFLTRFNPGKDNLTMQGFRQVCVRIKAADKRLKV